MPDVPPPELTEEEKQQSSCSGCAGDPDYAHVLEIPKLCLDDRPRHLWIYPVACDWKSQPVCEALWIRAVDSVLVICSWVVRRAGWLPRGLGLRFPLQEDGSARPPSHSHVDRCHGRSSDVHHVVWHCPRLSSQHRVGILCD